MKVLLDGKEVEGYVIDVLKHRFLGTFRNPNPWPPGIYDVVTCNCQHNLWTREDVYNHWLKGHFDLLQYQTI